MPRSNVIAVRLRHARSLAGALIALAAVGIAATSSLRAEPGFPNRALRILVPYGAGGVGDLTMRFLAQKMTEHMGKQVVIENRPGAGGLLAAKAVLDFPPDGYTLLEAGNGAAIGMSLFKVRPYNPLKDFSLISVTASFELLIATPENSKFKTLSDILDAARKNPGKLNFGAINPGSTQNLSAHLLKQTTGIDATIVTYRTTPELITALLRNDIDVGFDYYAGFQSAIADHKIRIAATTGEARNPLLPDVPTAKESGVPDFVVVSWNAIAAPAGLPDDVLAILNREINLALADPELKAKTERMGMNAAGSTPAEMRARMEQDINRWAGVIEKAGIERQ
jgi:tripartite-type tricarboxylate transporter receptor subunit TctC